MENNVNEIEVKLMQVAQENNQELIDYYLQELISNL